MRYLCVTNQKTSTMENRIQPKLYLRKDKIDGNGRMPLFIRFRRIDGKEPKFSMGNIRLTSDEIDTSTNLPKDEFLNMEVKNEILRIEKEIHCCKINGIAVTYEKLKEIVKGKKKADPQDDLFIKHYQDYLDMKERNGLIRLSTIKSHLSLIKSINAYNSKLRVRDINATNINKFIDFLRKRRKQQNNRNKNLSFGKRLSQIKTIIQYISGKNIPIQNPFRTGEIVIPPCGRCDVYLNDKELSKMIQLFFGKELSITENRVLMMYLLACCTGIRISDARKLKWSNVDLECKNGVVCFCCEKTQRNNFISLNPMAKEILCYAPEGDIDNVESNKNVFVRVYSKTEINKALKKLAKRAGISKDITFHSARRTFATLCNANDIPSMKIQRLLGHKPSNVTERYCQWNIEEADKVALKLSFFDMDRLRIMA